jgi:hypothetical protein
VQLIKSRIDWQAVMASYGHTKGHRWAGYNHDMLNNFANRDMTYGPQALFKYLERAIHPNPETIYAFIKAGVDIHDTSS